jgi:hypothetical protein
MQKERVLYCEELLFLILSYLDDLSAASCVCTVSIQLCFRKLMSKKVWRRVCSDEVLLRMEKENRRTNKRNALRDSLLLLSSPPNTICSMSCGSIDRARATVQNIQSNLNKHSTVLWAQVDQQSKESVLVLKSLRWSLDEAIANCYKTADVIRYKQIVLSLTYE